MAAEQALKTGLLFNAEKPRGRSFRSPVTSWWTSRLAVALDRARLRLAFTVKVPPVF
jgi:hypothetical protein